MVSTTEARRDLLLYVQALIESPDADAAFLEAVERTLTDGYAHALALEGEQRRLSRRLGEVTNAIADAVAPPDGAEITTLTRRLRTTDAELAELRGMLASLRERRGDLRAA